MLDGRVLRHPRRRQAELVGARALAVAVMRGRRVRARSTRSSRSTCAADQIVGGTAINFLALGITGLPVHRHLRRRGHAGRDDLAHPRRPPQLPGRAGTSSGRCFGQLNLMIWLAAADRPRHLVVMFKTPIGLRIRAVGEHPRAAGHRRHLRLQDPVRVAWSSRASSPRSGGAYLSIGFVDSFNENMTAGRGFIALAALIFGNWRPFGACGACLLFGFSSALAPAAARRTRTSAAVLFQALPYVLTLIAVRRSHRPLDPARSRWPSVHQAVTADRRAGTRACPSSSACSRSPCSRSRSVATGRSGNDELLRAAAAIPRGGALGAPRAGRSRARAVRGSQPTLGRRTRGRTARVGRVPAGCFGFVLALTAARLRCRARCLSFRASLTRRWRQTAATMRRMFEIGNSLREARLRQSTRVRGRQSTATKIRGEVPSAPSRTSSFELLPAQHLHQGLSPLLRGVPWALDGQLYVDEVQLPLRRRRGGRPRALASTGATAAAPGRADRRRVERRPAGADRDRASRGARDRRLALRLAPNEDIHGLNTTRRCPKVQKVSGQPGRRAARDDARRVVHDGARQERGSGQRPLSGNAPREAQRQRVRRQACSGCGSNPRKRPGQAERQSREASPLQSRRRASS